MQSGNPQMENMPLESGFNLKEYGPRIWANWWLIVLSLVVCLGLAWFHLRYRAIPQYSVTAKILIEDDNASSASENGLNLILGGGGNKDNEVAILQTRSLMEHLVRDHRLNEYWYLSGKFKDAELFDVPFELTVFAPVDSIAGLTFEIEALDKDRFKLTYMDAKNEVNEERRFDQIFQLPRIGTLKISNPENKDVSAVLFKVQVLGLDGAVGRLRSSLSAAASNKQTSIVDLGLTTAVPKKGEIILSKFIQEYINQNIRDKSRIADSTIKFIDERILLVNAELNGIEGNIQDFMQERGLSNIEAQSQIILQNDNTYMQELTTLEAQMDLLQALKNSVQIGKGSQLIAGSILGEDQNLNVLISSYNELTLERERLQLSYTPDNPFIKNVDQQLKSVEQNIVDYIENTYRNLELKKKNLSASSRRLKGDIREVPAQERAFLELSRQQQLKQDLYLFLLQKREETAVSKTGNIAGIRVIDRPKAAGAPFQPKPSTIWTVAFIVALIIPAGKILAEDLLNNKIGTRKDIEKRTQVPIVAELNHNVLQEDFITFTDSRSPLAEQFRALRTNLQFMLPDLNRKVLMVTSSIPGEGKSFTSLNLAQVLSLTGKKVLLLELDLRKPKLTKLSQAKGNLGVTDYIVKPELQLSDVIGRVEGNEKLFFVPAGPIPPNPSELLVSERMQQLLAEAKAQYDMVILDVPPIGAVADAQIISKFADAILYLVRAGKTPHSALEIPDKLVREGKLKNLGIVLNDVNEKDNAYYGYTYYSYGYYGHEEDRPRKWWERLKRRD